MARAGAAAGVAAALDFDQSDEKSRVLNYRMTSQCASGSGQFLDVYGPYFEEPTTGLRFDVWVPATMAPKTSAPSSSCITVSLASIPFPMDASRARTIFPRSPTPG